MTKAALVNPNFHESTYLYPEGKRVFHRVWENLPLEYCAAVLLERGVKTKYIDAHAENLTPSKATDEVSNFSPEYVIISSTDYDRFCCPQFETKELDTFAEKIKSALPESKIIAVGPHGTYWPDRILKNENIDFITRKEYDYTVHELISALEEGKDVKQVKGIGFRSKGEKICTPHREFIKDLDSLHFPYREKMERYFDSARSALFDFGITKELRPMALMIGSRGCPMRCVFCLQKSFFGKQYRMRSPENIVDEMEILVNKHKVKYIWFLDEMLTFNKKRCLAVCDSIIERGTNIQWCCNSRVDRIDDEMLKNMKKAGCQSIMYGVESCYQPVLDALKKDITVNQIKKAVTLTKKNGIVAKLFLLWGSPRDSKRTMQECIKFIEEVKPQIAVYHDVIPYPTTELFNVARKEKKVKDGYDWNGICRATGMVGNSLSPRELVSYGKILKRRFLINNLTQLFGPLFFLNPRFISWFVKSFRMKDLKKLL